MKAPLPQVVRHRSLRPLHAGHTPQAQLHRPSQDAANIVDVDVPGVGCFHEQIQVKKRGAFTILRSDPDLSRERNRIHQQSLYSPHRTARSSVREPGGRCRPSRIHTHPPPNTGNTRTRLLGARTLLARENRERYQRHSCAECTIRGDDGRCWRSTERGVPHVEAQRAGTTQPDRGCRIHRQDNRAGPLTWFILIHLMSCYRCTMINHLTFAAWEQSPA